MTSIVTSVAKTLGNLSLTEVQYLYKVKDKIERLKDELEWMQCYLIDAEKPKEDQDHVTRKNMSDLRESAYVAEDIIDTYLGKVSHPREDGTWNSLKWLCHLSNICEAWTLHNLGSKIDKLTEEMAEQRSRLIPSNTHPTRRNNDVRQTYPHTQEVVVGLEEDVDKVVNKLTGSNVNVAGICGTGGLGKTTLARKVFNDHRTKQHFNCAWAYVSRQVNKTNVFKAILNGLIQSRDERKEMQMLGDEELPRKISEILQERKCLVILDDIWKVNDWILLRPAFESVGTSASSKILLTTRNKGILDDVEMPGIYSHNLEHLNEKDRWKLFLLKANISGVESSSYSQNEPQVDAEMKKLVNRCKGLPLAISALAGIVGKKKTPLKPVLENLSWYLTTHNDLRWLELSYYDLPFYLKPCFLYLGYFPEDYKIRAEKLYALWDAEGFLSTKDKYEGETNLEIGERYLNELIQRSLVEVAKCWPNGRIKSCQVHDIMRDICLEKCKDVRFLDTQKVHDLDWESILVNSDVKERSRRCSVYVEEGFDASGSRAVEEAQYLRALFIFLESKRRGFPSEIISDIKKLFPLLRVLDLQDSWVDGEIPNEIGKLIHLKYLSLRNASITKLPSGFWDLEYLVTLDLRCKMSWSINGRMRLCNKFKEMKSLRHLYLPKRFTVKGGEKLSFRVECMETLKNFNPQKCQLSDLSEMRRLRIFTITSHYYIGSHEDLKRLCSVIKSGLLMNTSKMKVRVWRLIDEDGPTTVASLLNGLTRLTLDGKDTSFRRFPRIGMEVLPQTLTHLRLQSLMWTREISSALAILPHLEFLQLCKIYLPSAENKMIFPANSYPHLKTLHIMNIEGSWEWKVEDGALPQGRILSRYIGDT